MTEDEKRDYQASWESIRKRGENITVWTAPELSEAEKIERERQIQSGELPF